ncbi:NifU-like protein [Grimontia marina]|uniref:NifU-like protein n=2 Tax=Grimontia marina TaxID=646534 RepID=A0A128EZR7_9GAMM|nr:NifU-like protein [Grimontia marina]
MDEKMDKIADQRSLLMAHYRHPKGHKTPSSERVVIQAINPVCGDQISLAADIQGGKVSNIEYSARACSICIASASIMTTLCCDKPIGIFEDYYTEIRSGLNHHSLEKTEPLILSIVDTVSPSRKKCALLPWDVLNTHINNAKDMDGKHDLGDVE